MLAKQLPNTNIKNKNKCDRALAITTTITTTITITIPTATMLLTGRPSTVISERMFFLPANAIKHNRKTT
jgi:hypothetical protein